VAKDVPDWQRRRTEWLSDPATPAFVQDVQLRVHSPTLQRELQLFGRVIREVQVEQHPAIVRIRSGAQRKIAQFRPSWKRKTVDRSVPEVALRNSPRRRERRSAYYAEEPLYRPLEADLRRLVELRNGGARELGFRSFPEYKLEAEGLTVSRLYELMDSALAGAPGRLRRIQEGFRDRTGQSDWHPWDLDYARGTETGISDDHFPANRMLSDVLHGVRGWGFRAAQLKFRVDWHDTPSGGMEISVDPPRDVRVVATAQPGWLYLGVLFHEIGHAIHARSTRVPSPLLRRPGSLPGFNSLCEGIGTVFEGLASTREWLASRGNISPEAIERSQANQQESELVWMAYHADRVRAEIELYLHPERDPAVARSRFLRAMFGYDDFRPLAVANAFTIDNPVYLPSYVLASLFAKQVIEGMLAEIGGPIWPNPRVGPWLTEHWLCHGARHDWIPWIRETTGQAFGAGAFRRSISRT